SWRARAGAARRRSPRASARRRLADRRMTTLPRSALHVARSPPGKVRRPGDIDAVVSSGPPKRPARESAGRMTTRNRRAQRKKRFVIFLKFFLHSSPRFGVINREVHGRSKAVAALSTVRRRHLRALPLAAGRRRGGGRRDPGDVPARAAPPRPRPRRQ